MRNTLINFLQEYSNEHFNHIKSPSLFCKVNSDCFMNSFVSVGEEITDFHSQSYPEGMDCELSPLWIIEEFIDGNAQLIKSGNVERIETELKNFIKSND